MAITHWIPDRKIASGGIGSIATFFLLGAVNLIPGVMIPEEMHESIAAVVGWVIAYMVPVNARDLVRQVDRLVADEDHRNTLGDRLREISE